MAIFSGWGNFNLIARQFKITNPSSFRRNGETVEINSKALVFHTLSIYIGPSESTMKQPETNFDLISATLYSSNSIAVMDGVSSRILDSQIDSSDSNSNSVPHKLFIQVDLAPHETRTFYILYLNALPAVPPPIVKASAPENPSRRFPAPRDPPLQVTIGN